MDKSGGPKEPYQPRDHLRSDAPNVRRNDGAAAKQKAINMFVFKRDLKAAVVRATIRGGQRDADNLCAVLMTLWDLEQERISKAHPAFCKGVDEIAELSSCSTSTCKRQLRTLKVADVLKVVFDPRGGKRKSAGRRLNFSALLQWLEDSEAKPSKWLSKRLANMAEKHPIVALADTYRFKRGSQPVRGSEALDAKTQENIWFQHGYTGSNPSDYTGSNDPPSRSDEITVGDPKPQPEEEIGDFNAQPAALAPTSCDGKPSQEIDTLDGKHATSRNPTWPEFWKRHAKLGRSIHTIRAMAVRDGLQVPDLKPVDREQVTHDRSRGGSATRAEVTAFRSAFDKYYNLSALDPDAWA